MYAASYNGDGSTLSLPDGYSGTMLPKDEEAVETVREIKEDNHKEDCESVGHSPGIFSGLFGNIAGGSFLRDFKLGSEEILIIGAALFLLLSGSADIECIIILAVLLFIK